MGTPRTRANGPTALNKSENDLQSLAKDAIIIMIKYIKKGLLNFGAIISRKLCKWSLIIQIS